MILPTLNAAPYLPELLGRLKAQRLIAHEIILVDSSSDDETAMVAQQFGVTLLTLERNQFDHGGTRNYAVSFASGDVFVFLTQDALPENDMFLESLIAPFRDETVAAVYGRQVARSDASLLERMNREFNYPAKPMSKSFIDIQQHGIQTFFFTNVCSAIRRDEFHSVGGFPEPIILNEDMIIASKLITCGFSIVYNPDARVIHSHNYTLLQLFRRYFDIGVSLRLHDWLLKYVKAEGEGLRLIKSQFNELRARGRWSWILRWLLESSTKYIGYRLGISYSILPRRLCKLLSMHKFFWRKENLAAAQKAASTQGSNMISSDITTPI